MIDKHELRFGNIVGWDKTECSPIGWENHPFIITEFAKDGVHCRNMTRPISSYCPFDLLRPIPITPEWLERLGFVVAKDGDINIAYLTLRKDDSLEKRIVFFDLDDGFGVSLYDIVPSKAESFVIDVDIAYIHQLQNLYFALTGSELTPI